MAHLHGSERERYVKNTFREIARNYRPMNHLMTLGMDMILRKEVIRHASLRNNEAVLDAGTGTGDLAREARRRCPGARIIGADFSWEMMTTEKDWRGIRRCAADALCLPFDSGSFDVVISGYLVRNVIDLEAALLEQFRVLKPGGRVFALETTQPRKNLFTPFVKLYFRTVIPLLGQIFTGNRDAYTYLSQTSEFFISAETLSAVMRRCGFAEVDFRVRMFGTMTIHSAKKDQ